MAGSLGGDLPLIDYSRHGRLSRNSPATCEWGSEGREFKSHRPDHPLKIIFHGNTHENTIFQLEIRHFVLGASVSY